MSPHASDGTTTFADRDSGTEPSISIALATFNGGRFLQEQLDSLARQTRLPNELVVVDDGSSDNTIAILKAFAEVAPFPVRVHRNEQRLGWRGNFMKAAGLCQSDLVAFCDQDDIWYEEKIEATVDGFDSKDVLLNYHDADLIDTKGTWLGSLRSEEADIDVLLPMARPTIWSNPLGLTLTFRASLLAFQPYWNRSTDPCDITMNAAHDQWFYYLASNLGQVRYTSKRLLAYRQHDGNAVGFKIADYRSPRRRGWDAKKDGYIEMLDRFCEILQQAKSDRLTIFDDSLEPALSANRLLSQRLRLNRRVHQDRRLIMRMHSLLALLRQHAFRRSTKWGLGYSALLQALLVGIPLGR